MAEGQTKEVPPGCSADDIVRCMMRMKMTIPFRSLFPLHPNCLTLGVLFLGCFATACQKPPDRTPTDTVFRPPVLAKPELPKPAVEELVRKHGEQQRPRIERGLSQVAALWQATDGDMVRFAHEHFVSDEQQLASQVARLQRALEQLDGHNNEIARELKWSLDTDAGPLLPVDHLLSSVDPFAHTVEDLFASKVGFWVLLNLPLTTLQQRLSEGETWSRSTWAQVRLALRFARRIPPLVTAKVTQSVVAGERYVAGYNLYLHHLIDENGRRLGPKGLRLISHWNLRDEIRAAYADKDSVSRQRTIAKAMQRIVEQTIPQAVIDDPRFDWNPHTNEIQKAPPQTVEANPPSTPIPSGELLAAPEPDTRYALLLAQAQAQRLIDPYSPSQKDPIDRSFQNLREIPEAEVVRYLVEICSSPLIFQLASLAEKQLGRKLSGHDVWYSGFRPRNQLSEQLLDERTRLRYPTRAAFEADLPRLLQKLSFTQEKAKFLSEHIRVDAARGAGHAMPALRRGDFPRLRTRVGPNGMDYKGYNIAIHELGHNVEQVFSLYEVGDTLLAGVPNNAFTEALAFVFQRRDLELLDLGSINAETERLRILADFWETWEIAGVALVEIAIWHFLVEHPNATPAALRQEVVRVAKETWNRFYAPVLHDKDLTLLGIYSHMFQNTLYLPDYPIGHLITAQIEEHLAKLAPEQMGAEFEKMARIGQLTPDLWLKKATGHGLSPASLFRLTEAALKAKL